MTRKRSSVRGKKSREEKKARKKEEREGCRGELGGVIRFEKGETKVGGGE